MEQFNWFLQALLLIILVRFVVSLFHIDAGHLFHILVDEFRDLLNREFTVGALNALCIVVVTVFGIVVIAATEIKAVMNAVSELIRHDKIEAFSKAASFDVMFFVLAFVAIFSIVANLLDRRQR